MLLPRTGCLFINWKANSQKNNKNSVNDPSLSKSTTVRHNRLIRAEAEVHSFKTKHIKLPYFNGVFNQIITLNFSCSAPYIKSRHVNWCNKLHLRGKTIYKRPMAGVGSTKAMENGAPVGTQAILGTVHCRSFSDVRRQSVSRSSRTHSKIRFPPGKLKSWPTDLEVVPSRVTCSWRFKKLIHRQIQVTMGHLVHHDESSTEEVSLHRGKFKFVEAFWIR